MDAAYNAFNLAYQYGHHHHGGHHDKPGHPSPPPGHPGHPGHPDHPGWHPISLMFDHVTKSGHIALWVFFGLFAAGFIGTFLIGWRIERKTRVLHYLSALALAITTMTYFALCTGLGTAGPQHGFHGHRGHHGHNGSHFTDFDDPVHIPEKPTPHKVYVREVLWLRDAAHILTVPLYVAQLAVLSGMAPINAGSAIIAAAFASISTVAADHFGMIHHNSWPNLAFTGWVVLGLLWTLASWVMLFFPGITAARTRKRSTQGLVALGIVMLIIGWAAYPIIMFLGTGINLIRVNTEVIVLGIVDVIIQLGLTYFILFTHKNDPEDPVWSFPDWFVNPRGGVGADGRGSYAAVAAGDDA